MASTVASLDAALALADSEERAAVAKQRRVLTALNAALKEELRVAELGHLETSRSRPIIVSRPAAPQQQEAVKKVRPRRSPAEAAAREAAKLAEEELVVPELAYFAITRGKTSARVTRVVFEKPVSVLQIPLDALMRSRQLFCCGDDANELAEKWPLLAYLRDHDDAVLRGVGSWWLKRPPYIGDVTLDASRLQPAAWGAVRVGDLLIASSSPEARAVLVRRKGEATLLRFAPSNKNKADKVTSHLTYLRTNGGRLKAAMVKAEPVVSPKTSSSSLAGAAGGAAGAASPSSSSSSAGGRGAIRAGAGTSSPCSLSAGTSDDAPKNNKKKKKKRKKKQQKNKIKLEERAVIHPTPADDLEGPSSLSSPPNNPTMMMMYPKEEPAPEHQPASSTLSNNPTNAFGEDQPAPEQEEEEPKASSSTSGGAPTNAFGDLEPAPCWNAGGEEPPAPPCALQ